MSGIPHLFRRRDNSGGTAMLYAWFGAMHSRVDIAVVGDMTEEHVMQAVGEMRRRIAGIENMANRFAPDSEIAAINRHAADDTMDISAELESIIAACIHYHGMTHGLFDITIGSDSHQVMTTIGEIVLPGDGTIAFRRHGIRIDLSGYLKGYALEQMRPILRDYGIADALLNIGNSSVMATGNMADGAGWAVNFGSSNRQQPIVLHDQCLTTSGNDSGTRRHIADPYSGQLISGQRTISVINSNGAEGEVLSTSMFIDKEARFTGFGPFTTLTLYG